MTREPQDHEHEHEAPIAGLRGLALDAQPSRDLWPEIAARLAPRRRGLGANGWLSLAAAACVMLVVGLALVPVPQPQDTISVAREEQMSAAANLRAAPGSRALVKANLQLSRQSVEQIRRALAQDPDSASLQRLLRTTEARSDELHRMLAAHTT